MNIEVQKGPEGYHQNQESVDMKGLINRASGKGMLNAIGKMGLSLVRR